MKTIKERRIERELKAWLEKEKAIKKAKAWSNKEKEEFLKDLFKNRTF